jgi:hypothetical protein
MALLTWGGHESSGRVDLEDFRSAQTTQNGLPSSVREEIAPILAMTHSSPVPTAKRSTWARLEGQRNTLLSHEILHTRELREIRVCLHEEA